MKKNTIREYIDSYTFYLECFPRQSNPLRLVFFGFCTQFSLWATLIIETFTRKDFGIRHFVFAPALRLAGFLAFLPFVPSIIRGFIASTVVTPDDIKKQVPTEYQGLVSDSVKPSTFTPAVEDVVPATDFSAYILWYAFLAVFVYMAFRHWQVQRKRPSIFDKAYHTLYAGTPHEWLFGIQLPWIKTNRRVVECWYEPGIFFISGWFMYMIGQNLGILFMVAAVIYSGYAHSGYYFGRDGVLNAFDEMLDRQIKDKLFGEDSPLTAPKSGNPYINMEVDETEFRKNLHRNLTANKPSFQAKIPH